MKDRMEWMLRLLTFAAAFVVGVTLARIVSSVFGQLLFGLLRWIVFIYVCLVLAEIYRRIDRWMFP